MFYSDDSQRGLRRALTLLTAVLTALSLFADGGTAQAAGPAPAAAAAQPAAKPPKPKAKSWLVADLNTGQILAWHATGHRRSPASVQKVLTALALEPVIKDKRRKHRVSRRAARVDGTKVGLRPGFAYSADALFHAMLIHSANDAAYALGDIVGGQRKALKLMRAKARQLGMQNTRPVTTSGLDGRGQHTTVIDLAILAKAAVKSPYVMRIVGKKTYRFPAAKNPATKHTVRAMTLHNHTKIIGRLRGARGIKNGYTVKAGGSFLAVATRGRTTYVAAILGARSGQEARLKSAALINWAFKLKRQPNLGTVPGLAPRPAAKAPAKKAHSGQKARPAKKAGAQAGDDKR